MKYSTLLLLIAIQALTVWSFAPPHEFLNQLNDQYSQLTLSDPSKAISKDFNSLMIRGATGDEDHNESDSNNSDQGQNEKGYRFYMKWEDLPQAIKQFIKDHPYQSCFYTINGVVFLAPGLIWGPILGALGFTGIGPAAGSTAAFVQSWIHPLVSKGIFATFQSAKMGGYGVGIMNTAIRTGMGFFSGGCGIGGCFDGNAEAEAEAEEGEGEGEKEDETLIVGGGRVDL